jgi:hypothetical protein
MPKFPKNKWEDHLKGIQTDLAPILKETVERLGKEYPLDPDLRWDAEYEYLGIQKGYGSLRVSVKLKEVDREPWDRPHPPTVSLPFPRFVDGIREKAVNGQPSIRGAGGYLFNSAARLQVSLGALVDLAKAADQTLPELPAPEKVAP